MSVQFLRDSELGKWLTYFFGLRFLPPAEVIDGYIDLLQIAPADNHPSIRKWTVYLEENYILFARFPSELWASPPSEAPRTTNGPESFHSSYNAEFYYEHPSCHAVVQVLKEVQAESSTKIYSIDKQVTKKPRKDAHDANAEAITHWLTYKANPNPSTRLEYIKVMGHLFKGKKLK